MSVVNQRGRHAKDESPKHRRGSRVVEENNLSPPGSGSRNREGSDSKRKDKQTRSTSKFDKRRHTLAPEIFSPGKSKLENLNGQF